MPQELPLLPSYKNVGALFGKIKTARIPETFTHKFLSETIGLKGSGDRALITLLKNLGFLDNAGKPTSTYALLKNDQTAAGAIAAGVRSAYEPLFAADERAHTLGREQQKGLIAQVSGADTNSVTKILGTFTRLVDVADFNDQVQAPNSTEDKAPEGEEEPAAPPEQPSDAALQFSKLRPDFHYNIQIHLPANESEETYLNIFNALRKVFK